MARMTQKEMTRLQGIMAVASFAAGVAIACVCLYIVPPPGEISNSAISIVSELLVLAGAILGVKTSYDAKWKRRARVTPEAKAQLTPENIL